MANEFDELEYVKGDATLSDEEMNKLDGTRIKVGDIRFEEIESKYAIEDIDAIAVDGTKKTYKAGSMLPEGMTVKAKVVVLETVPVKTSDTGTPICIKERFSLKKHKTKGTWVASLHEKSKTFKLFKKYGKNSFQDFKNSEVILTKKVGKTGKGFMGISVG